MNVISFSLFGGEPKYLVGLQKNIHLIKQYYPNWEIIVYHDNSVPVGYLSIIGQQVILRDMTDSILVETMWRFLAHDEPNVERFIIRDADSRIGPREVEAVNEWIKSEKVLHLMRDHPHHGYVIMGGMWGMIPQKEFNMREAGEDYIKRRNNIRKWSMTDMDFLRDVVYPLYGINSKIHATYAKFEPWAEEFPSALVDKKFVGEIWQADDSRDPQYNLL
jgi:hypothetical protein